MKQLLAISLLGLFILSGCQNDTENNTELTANEASQKMNDVADQLGDDIVSIVESDGLNALLDLSGLMEGSQVMVGRASDKTWTKERIDILVQYFVKGPAARAGNEGVVSFEDIKGLYVWNPELQDFDKEPSEYFIVRFPAEGSMTNNAELKISDLHFVTIFESKDGMVEEIQIPSVIRGYLKIDDLVVITLDIDVNWSNTGEPEKANISLFIAPFTFDLSFDDTFEKSASLLASVSMHEEVIVGIDVDVTFETADKTDPVYFEGYVQYRVIRIVGNVDFKEIGVDANPNSFIDLALYTEESKVGDVVFVLEQDDAGFEDYVAYVQYPDGNQENLDDMLTPVFEEIETILTQFK